MELDIGGHLDETTLERYVMGTLSDAAAVEAEQHLLICERCRQRVTDSDNYIQAMRSAAATMPAAPERSRWGFQLWIPVLVCVAVVVFAVIRQRAPGALPIIVTLATTRGAQLNTAPAGRPLQLQPDLRGLPASQRYLLKLVTASGESKWSGEFQPPSAMLPAQTDGRYFVRVLLPDGALLREYELEVSR